MERRSSSMTDTEKPLYPRDLRAVDLEPHYCRHVSAMTTEQLHSKADIAEQLAWRDQVIEQLRARVGELESASTECAGKCGGRATGGGMCGECLDGARLINKLALDRSKARAESAEARVKELEASARLVGTHWTSNGEAGDGQLCCDGCEATVDEEATHTVADCRRVWEEANGAGWSAAGLADDRAESAEARVKELEAELSAYDVSEDELAAARDITRDYDEVRYRLVHLAGREEPGGDPIREFVTEIESRVELLESQLEAVRELAENIRAFVAKSERRTGLLLEAWKAETDLDQCSIYNGRHAELMESLTELRAILEVEAKGG